jgi:hypothetical protein
MEEKRLRRPQLMNKPVKASIKTKYELLYKFDFKNRKGLKSFKINLNYI